MFRRLCAFLLSAAAVLCACRGAPHCLALSPGAAARSQDAANAAPQDPFAGYPLRNAVVLTRELDTDGGSIFAETGFGRSEAGTVYTRTYRYPGGDTFVSERLVTRGTVSGGRMICDIALEGSGGTIRRHDGAGWRPEPLRSTELGQGMYFIRTDRQDLIVILPTVYRQLSNGVIEEIAHGIRSYIEKTALGWRLRTYASHIESGAYVDHTYLKSGGPLIDWSDPVSEKVWANFILTGRNRWAYDGYYYETPDTYYPTGENRYHRLVSAYITTKLIAAGGKYTAARELGLAMLDVMCRQQTDGFFPTLAGCTWLSEDYGIGPGFFDTRFNSDLVLSMLDAIEHLGAGFLRPTVDRYLEFFVSYVSGHGVGRTGALLVPDYWHPDGGGQTHTSLNHQCAEALTLFRLYEYSSDARCYFLGMSLVRGICSKADFWMSGEGGNLNYAWHDGSNYGSDYLYLTYNDLFKLQEALLRLRGSRDETLRMIMDHKLEWMISNGVTGYLGERP
ncbi:MAG: hypothetical protein GXX89_05180 [Clostridiales bacterium]|jgi:hypothetical protein|nr:hypothetical protein [Clostridiales bacterium]